ILDWQQGSTRTLKFPLRKKDSDVLSAHASDFLLYYGMRSGHAGLVDTRNTGLQMHFQPSLRPITCLGLHSSFAQALFTGDLNGEIALWDLRFLKENQPIQKFASRLALNTTKTFSFKIIEGSHALLAMGDSGLASVWDIPTGQLVKCWEWTKTLKDCRPLFEWHDQQLWVLPQYETQVDLFSF
ncbi:hypothetical protein HDU91_003942, partial [Kappamyces sp. JEL0680]